MRSGLDAATQAALVASQPGPLRSRVTVTRGVARDITSWLRGYRLELSSPATPIGSLALTLARESASATLAPGVDEVYQLQVGQVLVLAVQLGESETWYEVFRGRIVSLEWGNWGRHQLTVECLDEGTVLQRYKSETEHTYPAGTGFSATVTSILSNNGFTGVSTLIDGTPGDNSVLAADYEPGLQKTVWSQLHDVATAIGWSLAYRHVDGGWKLVFYPPARTKTTPDLTIEHWHDFSRVNIDDADIRNVGYLRYVDTENNLQTIGPIANDASIAKYGGIRRPFWIVLDNSSTVRTEEAANAMLAAAAADLADPDVIASVRTVPMPFLDVGSDVLRFENRERPRLFSADQTLAPFRASVVVEPDGEPHSIIQLRGKPSSGLDTWASISGVEPLELQHLITSLVVNVNGDTGAVTVQGTAVDEVKSVKYAYSVNDIDAGTFPTVEAATGDTGTVVALNDNAFTLSSDSDVVDPATPGDGEGALPSTGDGDATVDVGEAIRFVLVPYRTTDASDTEPGAHTFAQGTRPVPDQLLIDVAIDVNYDTGSVSVRGSRTTDRVQSVAYAYDVDTEATGSYPMVSAAVAQGTGADGGGLLATFDTNGSFSFALPDNTVPLGEAVRATLLAYPTTDGTGEMRGPPVLAKGSRLLLEETGVPGIRVANRLIADALRQTNDLTFSSVDWDTAQWTTGTVTTVVPSDSNADPVEYNTAAGNTGNMDSVDVRYVYLDPAVSTTVLQISTDLGAVPAAAYLIAVAWRSSDRMGRASIVDNPLIIRAALIDVAHLSAISASVGIITGGILQTGEGDEYRMQLNLNATGAETILDFGDALQLLADGNATFGGVVSAESFTGANPEFMNSLEILGGRNSVQLTLSSRSDQHGHVKFHDATGAGAGDIYANATGLVILPPGTKGVQFGQSTSKLGFFGTAPITKPTVT